MIGESSASRRPELGFFTEFSQPPGMSEAVAFEQAPRVLASMRLFAERVMPRLA
jgi:hypothetical protein